MSADALADLAAAAGLALDWEDAQGLPQRVAPDAARAILEALGHPCASEADCRDSLQAIRTAPQPDWLVLDAGAPLRIPGASGAARLTLESGERRDLAFGADGALPPLAETGDYLLEFGGREVRLAVCPPRCVTPRDRLGRRGWGLTAQVYSLAGPGGFGDFGDLAAFAAEAGHAGADALAISPVHALFAADPHRYSPYSPSSRERLNVLFADPAVGGVARRSGPAAPLIDWPAASSAKLDALRAAARTAADDPRFHAFVAAGGEDLRRHALFEALHGHFRSAAGLSDWRAWPAEFRNPASAAAAAARLRLAPQIELHLAFQWLADLGLERAQASAVSVGMAIGLITDLAVGLDPAGAQAWARPGELLSGLTLGAPPDPFQAQGQGWGITSFAPDGLRRSGFAPFRRTLRAALRHAGGVRIDHALGLKRIWVLPDGASPLEGAYLAYPFDDLLRLVALESQRAGGIVIGEDLGVVPAGLRQGLAARGLMGMRVLAFERTADGGFRAPSDYEPGAVALTSTHDLPPFAGAWAGRDIEWRERLGAPGDRAAESAARAEDRVRFWDAAVDAGAASGPAPPAEAPQAAVDAAIAFTAATPCELLLVPVEDLLGLEEQVNLPGVVEGHPNWRRRLPAAAAALFDEPAVRRRLARIAAERPR